MKRLPYGSSTWKPRARCQMTGGNPAIDRGSAARSRSIAGSDSGTGIGVAIRRNRVSTGSVGTGARALTCIAMSRPPTV